MKQGFWIRNGAQHDPVQALEMAVAAEAAGWDGVFLSDAVTEAHTEPFAQLAAIAARTERIALGTWVTPLVARDVVTVARDIAITDQLSGGRLLVGLGLGNPIEHDALGITEKGAELGARYDAALEVLAALLAGESVTRHDAWFDLDEVQLNVGCVQEPRPPILLGSTWPSKAPLRRAGRWDGAMPFWPGTAEGLDDEVADGANERELRALLAYYREHVQGQDIVLVPRLERFGPDYDELCRELGVDWVLTCDALDLDGVRAGPPA